MRTREFLLFQLILDFILLGFCYIFAWGLHYGDFTGIFEKSTLGIIFLVSYFFAFLFYINDFKTVYQSLRINVKYQLHKFVAYITIASLVLILFGFDFSRTIFIVTNLTFVILKVVMGLLIYYFFRVRNDPNLAPMIFVGNNEVSNHLFKYFQAHPYLGYEPLGILDDEAPASNSDIPIIGRVDQFHEVYDKSPFNEVLISYSLDKGNEVNNVIAIAERHGVKVRIIPTYMNKLPRQFHVCQLGDIPLLCMRKMPLDIYPNRFWKRAIDLLLGSMMILGLSPLFIFVAIAIKLESRGPVFYKPIRLGVNNQPFTMFKFRSMRVNDDSMQGSQSTRKDDDRITKVGKIIRRLSIDELPQLFNVIMNDMSLVGPRPHRVYLNEQLKQKMGHYMVRHHVKPGITGWAQIHGWRGPTETKHQYYGRTLHDLWYVEHWFFGLDFYILFMTIFGSKTKKNAF